MADPEYRERVNERRRARCYGLTVDRLRELLAGGCSLPSCGATENLVIDHDHACCPGSGSCGKCVRGVLCGPPNVVEGMLNGNPDMAMELAIYMRRWGRPRRPLAA